MRGESSDFEVTIGIITVRTTNRIVDAFVQTSNGRISHRCGPLMARLIHFLSKGDFKTYSQMMDALWRGHRCPGSARVARYNLAKLLTGWGVGDHLVTESPRSGRWKLMAPLAPE